MKKNLITIFFLTIYINSGIAQSVDQEIIGNLSNAEIELAKEQLGMGLSDELPKPQVTESTERVKIGDMNLLGSEIKYGYDFFSTVPTTITAVGDLPLPNDYKISLSDQFTIILSGSKRAIYDLEVKLDGTVQIPELGSLSVVNETLGDVKKKLKNLIEQSYVGVQIDVSIKELAAKKITIVGAVKTPGTYLVNPFSTISSALGYSGGISEIGTLRKIILNRVNGESFTFDLYKLLINGDRSDDITIQAGDVIIVNPAQQFIKLSGEVVRPAIYEVTDEEDLSDLFAYGLGLSGLANKTNINLSFLDIEASSVKEFKTDNLNSSLDNIQAVYVNKYVNQRDTSLKVFGAVKEPGIYDLSKFKTLSELIEGLEFIDVYPWLALIEQFDEKNLIKKTTLFSLSDPNTYKSIKLGKNSRVYFANFDERLFESGEINSLSRRLIEEYTLELSHKGTQYSLPVFGKFNVKDFINYLGLDMEDVEKEATYIAPLENIVLKDDYEAMEFTSKKFQNISFRAPVNDLIRVTISGAIDFPGTYVLKSNSTLSDLYDLIGNFKSEAFKDGIVLRRESVRNRQISVIERSKREFNEYLLSNTLRGNTNIEVETIKSLFDSIPEENLGRVSGNFSPGSEGSYSTILFNNDNVFIPKNPNVLNVFGEVLSPITFEYESDIRINDAIENAGGLKRSADKSRIYVIKANGLVSKRRKSVFLGSIDLEPGDTIIVPRKIVSTTPISQVLIPITTILSDLAFSAAALETLSSD
tara:strand:- start:5112 stop:7379 length:2268 start_codon:yes stop_codon:yes gene_type:complete